MQVFVICKSAKLLLNIVAWRVGFGLSYSSLPNYRLIITVLYTPLAYFEIKIRKN